MTTRTSGTPVHIEASADVPAPAADVCEMIADYRAGHQRIAPPEYFRNLRVLEGGDGQGTRIESDVLAFGRTIHSSAAACSDRSSAR
jgi:hypothetical protein